MGKRELLVLQTLKNQGLFGKGLNGTQTVVFVIVEEGNIVEKGENVDWEFDLLFSQCFQTL